VRHAGFRERGVEGGDLLGRVAPVLVGVAKERAADLPRRWNGRSGG
jgi:hypothetical protein